MSRVLLINMPFNNLGWPSLGLGLGWLWLEGGAVFKAYDATGPAGSMEARMDGVTPFARAALAVPLGPLELGLGARLMLTDTYTTSAGGEGDDPVEAAASGFAQAIVTAVAAVLGAVKLDLSIGYRAGF